MSNQTSGNKNRNYFIKSNVNALPNSLAKWDDATGEFLVNSDAIISDTGDLFVPNTTTQELYITGLSQDNSLTQILAADTSDSNKVKWVDKSTITSSGDVVGPVSSTDNAICRFDGTTGKIIQNSNVAIDDAGRILAANGSLTNPSFAFSSDPDTGFYRMGSNHIEFATGGTPAFEINNGYIQNDTPQILNVDGNGTTPSYSFTNSTGTGMYYASTNLHLSRLGGTRLTIDANAISSNLTPLRAPNGSAANCAFGNNSDFDSGLYFEVGGVPAISNKGFKITEFSSTGIDVTGNIDASNIIAIGDGVSKASKIASVPFHTYCSGAACYQYYESQTGTNYSLRTSNNRNNLLLQGLDNVGNYNIINYNTGTPRDIQIFPNGTTVATGDNSTSLPNIGVSGPQAMTIRGSDSKVLFQQGVIFNGGGSTLDWYQKDVLLSASWSGNVGTWGPSLTVQMYLTRVGNIVTGQFDSDYTGVLSNVGATLASPVGYIPVNFRPKNNIYVCVFTTDMTTSYSSTMVVQTNGQCFVYRDGALNGFTGGGANATIKAGPVSWLV